MCLILSVSRKQAIRKNLMDLAFLKYVFACARDEMHEGYRVVSDRKVEKVKHVRRRSLEKPTVEGDSPVI